jgi:hypothetical protein
MSLLKGNHELKQKTKYRQNTKHNKRLLTPAKPYFDLVTLFAEQKGVPRQNIGLATR